MLLPAVLLLPVASGLLATLLPAFGIFPALGGTHLSLDPWRALFAWPGLGGSVALTLWTGLCATALSLATALGVAVAARRARVLRAAQAAIVPLLATPHAALAIGFAFLAAPSGWIARLLSPGLTGWTAPPDVAIVHDRWGGALILGLWLKETPYLLLMILAALTQAAPGASLRVGAALGYAPWRAWLLTVLPRIWPQLRLPVLAVLAFSLSVVDVALVLGPGTPPPLAVQVLRWFDDPDLANWYPGCAGAMLLAALVVLCGGALLACERVVAAIGSRLLQSGRRGGGDGDFPALAAGGIAAALGLGSLAVLALWAGAASWRFPDALPQHWRVAAVMGRWTGLGDATAATLWIGAASTLLALALAIGGLRGGRVPTAMPPGMIIYLPLLVPQVAFLFGFQVLLVRLRLDGGGLALVWTHLTFVLPYVVLALDRPFQALDPRYARTAASLGASPARVLWRVTLPLLARPLLAAAAVGFAVSAGLYLPTLFAGAGRVATLTTEAVTLASGGDRRVLAATALAQAGLPLLVFAVAVGLPSWRARARRGVAIA